MKDVQRQVPSHSPSVKSNLALGSREDLAVVGHRCYQKVNPILVPRIRSNCRQFESSVRTYKPIRTETGVIGRKNGIKLRSDLDVAKEKYFKQMHATALQIIHYHCLNHITFTIVKCFTKYIICSTMFVNILPQYLHDIYFYVTICNLVAHKV